MSEDEERDLDDGEERDSHGRSHEDYLADQADIEIKEMKIAGTYNAWRKSGLSHGEWLRREYEDAYLRDKALFGPQEAPDA